MSINYPLGHPPVGIIIFISKLLVSLDFGKWRETDKLENNDNLRP